MAKWSEKGTKINKTDGDWDLNNGKKFEPTDGIRASDVNKVVESVIYTQITSDEAKDIANHAKEVAESIQGIAENAVDIAENAVDIAESAVNTATNAVTTAEEAKDMAQEAKDAVAQGMGTIVMENNEPLLVFDADKKMDKTPKEPKVVSDAFVSRITATNDIEIIDSPLGVKTAKIQKIESLSLKFIQQNGDMHNGTTNWEATGGTLSVGNGRLRLTLNEDMYDGVAIMYTKPLRKGRKYFIQCYVWTNYSTPIDLGLPASGLYDFRSSSADNAWNYLSGLWTPNTEDEENIQITIHASTNYQVGDVIEIADFRIVDESDSATAWTKAKFDEVVPRLPYFEGIYHSNFAQLKSVGDNLLVFDNYNKTETVNGITLTTYPDGRIKLNGTATAGTSIFLFGNAAVSSAFNAQAISCFKGQRVKYVPNVISGTHNGSISFVCHTSSRYASNNVAFTNAIAAEGTKVLVGDITGFRIFITAGATANNLVLQPMLLHADNPLTEYKPYTEHITILPQEQELTRWDKIDCQSNTKNVNTGKIVLSGTEDFTVAYSDDNWFALYLRLSLGKANGEKICTHFAYFKAPYRTEDYSLPTTGTGIYNNTYASNFLIFSISRNSFADINAFKNYLAQQYANGTPVTVWYELAEPIIEPLDKEYDATYPAWNYGLEQVFDADGNPTIAQMEIEYPLDLQKQVDTNTWIAQRNEDRIAQVANIRNDLTSGNLVVKIAQYASSDTAKGTIEERLTNLGFKSGSVSLSISGYGSMGGAALTRQGNYVIVKLNIQNANLDNTPSGTIGTLPPNFRPITSQEYRIGGVGRLRLGTPVYQVSCRYDLRISSSGVMSITAPLTTTGSPPADTRCSLYHTSVSIGFEAPPITT